MKYTRVYIDAIGHELPPVVVTSQDLEARLQPVYQTLRLMEGNLEALTGIAERRWWEPDYPLSQGAIAAARKCLQGSQVPSEDVRVVIYAGVCREDIEPATACKVAAALRVSPNAEVYDLSNACLGVLNGIVDVANRIELGQVRAGLVVSCESAREIVEVTIDYLLCNRSLEAYRSCLATLTGGSGAVAVLVTDGSFAQERRRKLLGGSIRTAPEHHGLSRWSLTNAGTEGQGLLHLARQFMSTDSANLLRFGVDLGLITYQDLLTQLGWAGSMVDRVICHQVGTPHRDSILKALGLKQEQDFSTYAYLGNIGTVSLPLTAALAEERDFLRPGNNVGLLGIGSGLNCLMLGIKW